MMVGGGLWAWDISTVKELRGRIRGALGMGEGEGRDGEVEEELEEWVAGVLERRERRGREREGRREG